MKVLLYPTLPVFRNSIAFWKVPRLRSFVQLVGIVKLIHVMYKGSADTSKRNQCVSIRKTNQWMSREEITSVHCNCLWPIIRILVAQEWSAGYTLTITGIEQTGRQDSS